MLNSLTLVQNKDAYFWKLILRTNLGLHLIKFRVTRHFKGVGLVQQFRTENSLEGALEAGLEAALEAGLEAALEAGLEAGLESV